MYPWKTFKCRSKEMQMECQLPDGYPGKLCLLQKLSIQLGRMWGLMLCHGRQDAEVGQGAELPYSFRHSFN